MYIETKLYVPIVKRQQKHSTTRGTCIRKKKAISTVVVVILNMY